MMREVLIAVQLKFTNPELAKFPYLSAIILIIATFMNALFDTLSNRFLYHYASNLRSGLAGLIYKKTLNLNITAQSNIDTGRLLSLLSADCNTNAMMFPLYDIYMHIHILSYELVYNIFIKLLYIIYYSHNLINIYYINRLF